MREVAISFETSCINPTPSLREFGLQTRGNLICDNLYNNIVTYHPSKNNGITTLRS